MKTYSSDKLLAYAALISGLTISAVAVWYSVAGLVAIFAASAASIIIMGVALEISKLVATVWLKWNWKRAPRLIKTYLISAIAILMLITSMGIFGYLSKAHLDQNIVSGEVQSKISLIDEKIKTENDNIEAAKRALAQMDAQVDQVLGRSNDERGAERAVQIRRNQARERTTLQNEISKAQAAIVKLNEEAAPIRAEVRKVEAEVGPIKYIAKLIYGDNPDANLLEKAVTWVIIIIVLVFDPLAVILLLSSQYSFQWLRENKDNDEVEPGPWMDDLVLAEKESEVIDKSIKVESNDPHPPGWMFPKVTGADTAPEKFGLERDEGFNEKKPLDEWNEMIAEAEKAIAEEEDEDHEILNSAIETEKQAMAAWKKDNPDSSLKSQRRLFERGIIDHLPWEDYLKPQADYTDNEAALEAAKWAQEQLNQRPGDYLPESESKKNEIVWMENENGHQVKKSKDGYEQNAEQNERTIWQRIQDAKK